MAGVATEEHGSGRSSEVASSGENQLQCQSSEALVEWRSSEQVENGIPSTSPPYWDMDDEDDGGPQPSELYGKYTWKIDKFSQINKRELRSNAFEVGSYKWYILIYPQGCDVCNHLSLFLCVANHDKLLPGWSHFAQFTIAVVNKDPKKSKYSDTLHRFWKKEHDWGWKKFMELSKVMDGFVDADTLIIKAQVQVIRERPNRPFRCLDRQYRRELVRVYLTNVEQICRRFVEERRGKLVKLIEDKSRWSSFSAFWMGMDQSSRRCMSREKMEKILIIVVKHFFIEKEVTSTLVMDSLYSGLKALEGQNKGNKSKGMSLEAEELSIPIVSIEKDMFVLVDDVLLLLERAAMEPLPPKEDKGPQNRTKDGVAGEESSRDSIERDERRLTELGRRTIQIFVLAHIFSKIEVSYKEAVSLRRQEELIREEEAAWLAEIEQKPRRGAADKEKKSKKKQGKQKKNNRKAKDKERDERLSSISQYKIEQERDTVESISILTEKSEPGLDKSDTVEYVSDASDPVDYVPQILPLDSEDREVSPVNWDTDTSEVHPPTEASSSGISVLSGVQNETEGRSPSAVDDNSSTCSSDSVPFVMIGAHQKGNSRRYRNQKSPTHGRSHQGRAASQKTNLVCGEPSHASEAVAVAGHSVDASPMSKTTETVSQVADSSSMGLVVNGTDRHMRKKEEGTGSLPRNYGAKDVDEQASGDTATSISSPPKNPSKSIPSDLKLGSEVTTVSDPLTVKKSSSNNPKQADKSVRLTNVANTAATFKPDYQKSSTPKPTINPYVHQVSVGSQNPLTQNVPLTSDKPSTQAMPIVSRPLSAPLIPGPRPAVSTVSTVHTAHTLARSVSVAGQLGPEPVASSSQSFVPQSYRNAIMGGHVTGTSPAYAQNHSSSSVVNVSVPYSQMFSPQSSGRIDPNLIRPNFSFGMVNQHDISQNSPLWNERPQPNSTRNFTSDHATLLNDMQSSNLNSSEFPAGTSGRQNHGISDEFPHLDIINDLLDDEQHVYGNFSRTNTGYESFNGTHPLNRQVSFPADPGMSSGVGPSISSCRFERSRSYHDMYQYGYGAPGSPYDVIPVAAPQPYLNGPIDGLLPNHWQMGGPDLSILSSENDGYLYHHLPEYQNLSVGVNGYTVFRPSDGR